MAKRSTPNGMVALGFQTISLANSTALGLNTTCIGAKVVHFSVETQNIRYRLDGVAPAKSTGILLTSGSAYWIFDINGSNLKFQRQTGTAKVSLMAWKYVGE
jgi:hypothetical protein